jgi:hypothetical protein
VRSTDEAFAKSSGIPLPDVENLSSGGIGASALLVNLIVASSDPLSFHFQPDIEIIESPLLFAKHGTAPPPKEGAPLQLQLPHRLNPSSLNLGTGTDFFTIAPILLRPKSKGTIQIKSKDIFVKPLICPQSVLLDDVTPSKQHLPFIFLRRYLTHENDCKVFVWALKLCIKVCPRSSCCAHSSATSDQLDHAIRAPCEHDRRSSAPHSWIPRLP